MTEFEDKLKRTVVRMLRGRARGRCPEEEILAAYAEGKLPDRQAVEVLGHLARCPVCRQNVTIVRQLLRETEAEKREIVSGSALARARTLDPASKGVMEVVVRFAQGVAEVVKMSSGVVGGLIPAASAIRGESRVVSETLVTFTKDFPPYRTEIDIERSKPHRNEITIRVVEIENQKPPVGLRVSLYEKERELESTMLEEGVAVFENLPFGQYRVEITRLGEPVAGITLQMKGEGT